MKPYLIERKCPVQADICTAIRACAPGAISYQPDPTLPLGGRIVFDYALCDACGQCADACCGHAIELRPDEA